MRLVVTQRCAWVVIACAGLAPMAWAQVQWKANVSDAYQHQRWGLPAGTPGIAGGADAGGDKDWQADYTPAGGGEPEDGGFGGWCFQVSTTNQLYHFNKRGYRTFGPAAGAPTNVANVTQLHDEVKNFVTAYRAAAGVTSSAKINSVLDARAVGPAKGVDGLLSQTFRQFGNSVRYVGADGRERKIGKGTIYEHAATVFKNGDMANLRLAYPAVPTPGTSQEGLWWAGPNPARGNFHVVTVAGLDKTAGTMWFADPDSNKGNANANSGWDSDIADWRAAPAGVAVKQRRYAAADAFAPAGAVPTNAERNSLYYEGKLDAGRMQFEIAAGPADRYDEVQISHLEAIETIKAAPKPAPAPGGPPPAEGKKFQVTPAGSTNKINEFWLFPNAADRVLTFTFEMISDLFMRGWQVELVPLGGVDPIDASTLREFGGVKIFADPTSPYWINQPQIGLAGNDLLEFGYETNTQQGLSAWDFVYNDSTDLTFESLGVQSVGGLAGYDLPSIQIPAPGVAGVVGLMGVVVARRRRR